MLQNVQNKQNWDECGILGAINKQYIQMFVVVRRS